MKPGLADAYYYKANAEFGLHLYYVANLDYNQAIRHNNLDSICIYGKANALNSIKQYEQALKDFSTALTYSTAYYKASFC